VSEPKRRQRLSDFPSHRAATVFASSLQLVDQSPQVSVAQAVDQTRLDWSPRGTWPGLELWAIFGADGRIVRCCLAWEHAAGGGPLPLWAVTVARALAELDARHEHEAEEARAPQPGGPPIWEKLVRLGEAVPPEEAAKLPRDLSQNLDHYLYGAPKKEDDGSG
jgi:hypothetical protein